ncbi:unnamed protein product [Periconia digitata]|uniref:Uncharacterized protein n=1 Tax=Periconia digitata TaxID=1303443 RepID=A0A9W4UR67_9PLEO|nr:unnamed protein product [Periconia digitata]
MIIIKLDVRSEKPMINLGMRSETHTHTHTAESPIYLFVWNLGVLDILMSLCVRECVCGGYRRWCVCMKQRDGLPMKHKHQTTKAGGVTTPAHDPDSVRMYARILES